MADVNVEITGKKTFFIHPSVFVQNEIIADLVQQEHEIYIAKDEEKLKKVLKNHPDSIVFASVDEAMSSEKWEAWIRSIMGNEATKSVSVGILSNTNSEDARRLYLNTLQVSCGFVPVKMERHKVVKALVDILNAAGAKGRRKYIRADTRKESLTTLNVPLNGTFITGEIQDISVVGLSCAFSEDIELKKNALVPDMQIKLQGVLLKAEGIVFGSRPGEGNRIYVFLFTQKLDPSVRAKIRTYIQKNLQSKMDEELK
jgi:hypothetical protein